MARRAHDVYTEWRGGTCRVKWWTGEYHPNGRKRFESKGGFTDEDVAYNHGLDQMRDIRHEVHVSNRDGSMPLSDWLDQWVASLDLAHRSVASYKWAINSHIRPYFAGKSIAQVDLLDYRAFRKHLGTKLAASTRKNVLMVFGMVMKDAVAAKLRTTSPVEPTQRRGRYTKKPRERKKDMAPAAVHQLAENAQLRWGDPGPAFFWTMAMTGMRPAELYGLTREYCYPAWPASDPRVDPELQEEYDEDVLRYGKGDGFMPAIRVERQAQYEGGKLGFYPPKYHSRRTLVIPPFLAEMLELLLQSHDSEYVFPAIEGGSLARIAFTREYWRPIASGAEASLGPRAWKPRPDLPAVPEFAGKRMYLLRHGHKAWLDEDGHSRYAVEARMGHEVPGVEGVYSSVTVPMEESIMKTLQQRWERLGVPAWKPGMQAEYAPRTTVASLVREAARSGAVLDDVLAAVLEARPDAKAKSVKRMFYRERRRVIDGFPVVSHEGEAG